MVEVPGFEPGSMELTQRVSTCLVYHYLFPEGPVDGTGPEATFLDQTRRQKIKLRASLISLRLH